MLGLGLGLGPWQAQRVAVRNPKWYDDCMATKRSVVRSSDHCAPQPAVRPCAQAQFRMPFVSGTIAWSLGKKTTTESTHKWTGAAIVCDCRVRQTAHPPVSAASVCARRQQPGHIILRGEGCLHAPPHIQAASARWVRVRRSRCLGYRVPLTAGCAPRNHEAPLRGDGVRLG